MLETSASPLRTYTSPAKKADNPKKNTSSQVKIIRYLSSAIIVKDNKWNKLYQTNQNGTRQIKKLSTTKILTEIRG